MLLRHQSHLHRLAGRESFETMSFDSTPLGPIPGLPFDAVPPLRAAGNRTIPAR